MLVIVPKDNLARTVPSRVAVVIESSRGSAATPFSFADDLAGRSENIAPGSTDQVTERWPQNRVERSAAMAARSTFESARRYERVLLIPT
jgi:hypothetical protein